MIQWCTHHKDDPPPPEDDENKEKRTDDIPVWDQEFLKVDQGTLFELILVNTVDIMLICIHLLKFDTILNHNLYTQNINPDLHFNQKQHHTQEFNG